MKTIARQLNIKKFPFEINDENGKRIYWEASDGFWVKREWDSDGNKLYFETSAGYWVKREYNSHGKVSYLENSKGYWEKCEFDSNGNRIYFEDSNGKIIDNRPPEVVEMTMEEVNKALGKNVKIIE